MSDNSSNTVTEYDPATSRWFRLRKHGHEEATPFELFFDLVFVFAVAQLAAFLAHHATGVGVMQTTFLLLVFWWMWTYTTWTVNFFDPRTWPVRMMLTGVMLGALLMAISIPEAFGDRALLFASAFVVTHIGRNAFSFFATRKGTELHRSNGLILIWSLIPAPLWIGGALAGGDTLIWMWVAALALEYVGPMTYYWVPGLGKTDTLNWPLDGMHFGERFHLLIIIALGETIIVTGNALANSETFATNQVLAMLMGFLAMVCLWWLYFDVVGPGTQHGLRISEDPGTKARSAFLYLHLPILAGIIAMAVTFEIIVAHPEDALTDWALAIAIVGPAMYLAGHNGVRYVFEKTFHKPRWVATFALLSLWLVGDQMSGLALMAIILAILATLAVWEAVSYRRWYPTVEDARYREALEHLGR